MLLLDEPLASLDPLARRDFLRVLVHAVREEGATAFLSSHIVTDVEEACDRLIVIAGGRVLLDDGVVSAKAGHAIATEGTEAAAGIGSFSAPDGAVLRLVLQPSGAGVREASLEEIVLGYLAAGQQTASVEAEWAAA